MRVSVKPNNTNHRAKAFTCGQILRIASLPPRLLVYTRILALALISRASANMKKRALEAEPLHCATFLSFRIRSYLPPGGVRSQSTMSLRCESEVAASDVVLA